MANQLEKMNQSVMTDLLVKLETKLDADVFTYYGEIVNGMERHVKDIIETLTILLIMLCMDFYLILLALYKYHY